MLVRKSAFLGGARTTADVLLRVPIERLAGLVERSIDATRGAVSTSRSRRESNLPDVSYTCPRCWRTTGADGVCRGTFVRPHAVTKMRRGVLSVSFTGTVRHR
jgi:hypothetical protein